MPIYEFFCPDNRKIYSFFARSLRYSTMTPRCPDNPNYRMERMISNFAVTGRAKQSPAVGGPASPQDDTRMEAAVQEIERGFGGLDSEHPDPRQLARMMRKMSALTGEQTPPQMDEMMRRMEAGEDLEKLECEFGDLMDDMEAGEKPGEEGRGCIARRVRRRVTRDPVLHDLSEFVD